MHLPDGFLSTPVWAGAWAVSSVAVSWCVRRVQACLQEKMIPLMGVMCAFVFAGQMLNFPVFGGTSGHLLGGVLAAVLLGPCAAVLVLTCVLVVQCLVFQDGGLTALGANILNMALLGTLAGWGVFYVISRAFKGKKGFFTGAACGAWVSVVLSSAACALELALSGTVEWRRVVTAMVGIHAVIGIGEALITAFVVEFVSAARPDLVAGKAGLP